MRTYDIWFQAYLAAISAGHSAQTCRAYAEQAVSDFRALYPEALHK